jgi:peptidoglycan-associated lipoprotein
MPFRDRVAGRQPASGGTLPLLDAQAPTGGAARWRAETTTGISYVSPHPRSGTLPSPISGATIEAWIRPGELTGEHTIVDAGPAGYRLGIVSVRDEGYKLRLGVGDKADVAQTAIRTNEWQHVLATFGSDTAKIFINGAEVASESLKEFALPSTTFLVGCAQAPNDRQDRCFVGDMGEVRIYPELWSEPPRIAEVETELQLADRSRHDFGQPLRVLARQDMMTAEDDVVTEYQYAKPVSQVPVLGLVSVETKRALQWNGISSGDFLAYNERTYDGLPLGEASIGNPTSIGQYDGPSPVANKPSPPLRVVTRNEYLDPHCPGRITKVTDPLGFGTTTTFDSTCTFPLEVKNALGHVSRQEYYGVNYSPAGVPFVSGPYGMYPLIGHYGQTSKSIDPNGATTTSTYDEWGRPLATWSPLDRYDRPGIRHAYADAVCLARFRRGNVLVVDEAPCRDPQTISLQYPALTTTYIWDDQLRRCKDITGAIVQCSEPTAQAFVVESSTGAYRVSHTFGDGQIQAQTVKDGKPGWTVSGIADFDLLGRATRTYKIQNLPGLNENKGGPCPGPGLWCDSQRPGGVINNVDVLRNVASVQTAYDVRGRVIRTYGPSWPRCDGDPSEPKVVNGIPISELKCDTPPLLPLVHDVTTIEYPKPGVTRTTDAHGVPNLVHSDIRGLVTLHRNYVLSPAGSGNVSTAIPYSAVSSTFDQLGRLTSTKDEYGNVTTNSYDALSRLQSSTDPDMGRTLYTYDLRSQLKERTIATGEKTMHVYDSIGRVIQTDYLRPRSEPSDPRIRSAEPDAGHTNGLIAKADSDAAARQLAEIRAEQVASETAGLRDVFFAYDSFSISDEGRHALSGAAEWAKSNPYTQLTIEGHCDERGTSAYNLVLGEKRAKAVRNYLVELGVAPARLSSVSYGKERPFCTEHTESCYSQNRRGHLVAKATTLYEPEERVHHTYDSHEPPYYIDTATRSGGHSRETKPVLDLTFDVPGVLTDRSPAQVDFSSDSCAFARLPSNYGLGISGRSLTLPAGAGAPCTANLKNDFPRSQFTAELWVRPQRPVVQQQNIVSADGLFAIALVPATDGRTVLWCGSAELTNPKRRRANRTSGVTGDAILPTDAWSHVALTYDGAVLRCFVNGVGQGQQTVTISAQSGATIRLGDALRPEANPASIDVDEVRLLAQGRKAAEILEDALRPLSTGAPRGNLVHLDFAHPSPPVRGTCPTNAACANQLDQSKGQNDALLIDGAIRPAIQGMGFDTRKARPIGEPTGLPPPDGQIRVAHSDTLELTNAVTAELWVKRVGTQAGEARLIGKWGGESLPGWRLQLMRSGRLRWEVVTTGGISTEETSTHRTVFVTQEAIDAGWHHVAATYDGQRMRVFKDGLPLHRWCGSGSQAGELSDPLNGDDCVAPPPPPIGCSPIESRETDLPAPDGKGRLRIGDTECIEGSVANKLAVLIANDEGHHAFDGYIDEVRISNYAKREFEVAASARLATEYTQLLGRESLLRNRFIWLDGKQVGPESNDDPYDLTTQPARELRAYDLQGRLVSGTKHVLGQRSAADFFASRVTLDSAGRNGLIEYPHGEVVVSRFDVDGTQQSLNGYGPKIGQGPVQAQTYIASAESTITGRPSRQLYGNGVQTSWTYDDGPLGGRASPTVGGGFGADTLKEVTVVGDSGEALSSHTYGWDAVGNLKHLSDTAVGFEATYTYDDLRRVKSATLTAPSKSPLPLHYDYDALGNLTLIDGKDAEGHLRPNDGAKQEYGRRASATCPNEVNPLPHAVTRRTVNATPSINSLCYDGSGRLMHSEDSLRNSTKSYTYFARGTVRSISDRDAVSDYLYDGNGVRVSKNEQGIGSQTILSVFYRELRSSTQSAPPRFESMYATDTGLVARRVLSHVHPTDPLTTERTDLTWFTKDHLSGTHFLTNADGTEITKTRTYYRPFGGFLDRTHPPQTSASGGRQFTSKELDATNLYDFGARLYDPMTGSFTQADDVPVGHDPLAQNRFAYAMGNPIKMIDPTGHQAESAEITADTMWQNDSIGGVNRVPIPNGDIPTDIPGVNKINPEQFSLLNDAPSGAPGVYQKAWEGSWDPEYQRHVEYLNSDYYARGWSYKSWLFNRSGTTESMWDLYLLAPIGRAGRILLPEGVESGYVSGFREIMAKARAAKAGDIGSMGEIEAAKYLRAQGTNVHFQTPVGPRGPGTADFLVGGQRGAGMGGVPWDVLTPRTTIPNNIVRNITSKYDQSPNIILNLRHTPVQPSDLGDVLYRVQVGFGRTDIKQILIIK